MSSSDSKAPRPKAPKRGSQIFSAFPIIRPVADEMDSTSSLDYESELNNPVEKRDEPSQTHETQELGQSSANHTTQEHTRPCLWTSSLDLPGGPNYRPLVGGYAAAAYEAAKSLHYSSINQANDSKTNNTSEPSDTNRLSTHLA